MPTCIRCRILCRKEPGKGKCEQFLLGVTKEPAERRVYRPGRPVRKDYGKGNRCGFESFGQEPGPLPASVRALSRVAPEGLFVEKVEGGGECRAKERELVVFGFQKGVRFIRAESNDAHDLAVEAERDCGKRACMPRGIFTGNSVTRADRIRGWSRAAVGIADRKPLFWQVTGIPERSYRAENAGGMVEESDPCKTDAFSPGCEPAGLSQEVLQVPCLQSSGSHSFADRIQAVLCPYPPGSLRAGRNLLHGAGYPPYCSGIVTYRGEDDPAPPVLSRGPVLVGRVRDHRDLPGKGTPGCRIRPGLPGKRQHFCEQFSDRVFCGNTADILHCLVPFRYEKVRGAGNYPVPETGNDTLCRTCRGLLRFPFGNKGRDIGKRYGEPAQAPVRIADRGSVEPYHDFRFSRKVKGKDLSPDTARYGQFHQRCIERSLPVCGYVIPQGGSHGPFLFPGEQGCAGPVGSSNGSRGRKGEPGNRHLLVQVAAFGSLVYQPLR